MTTAAAILSHTSYPIPTLARCAPGTINHMSLKEASELAPSDGMISRMLVSVTAVATAQAVKDESMCTHSSHNAANTRLHPHSKHKLVRATPITILAVAQRKG
eukprot:377895-Pelagomonas_calceolata.AAC.11